MALSDFVEEECRSAMIFDDMDITCLTVFAKQIEESKLKKYGVREKKRSRLEGDEPFDDGSDGHSQLRSRQMFYGQGFSNDHHHR